MGRNVVSPFKEVRVALEMKRYLKGGFHGSVHVSKSNTLIRFLLILSPSVTPLRCSTVH